jgi:hypothetical protein
MPLSIVRHVAPPGRRPQRRRKHVRVTVVHRQRQRRKAARQTAEIPDCDNGAGSRDRTDTPVKEQVFETCASTNSAMPAQSLAIAVRLPFANMGMRREDISEPVWPADWGIGSAI